MAAAALPALAPSCSATLSYLIHPCTRNTASLGRRPTDVCSLAEPPLASAAEIPANGPSSLFDRHYNAVSCIKYIRENGRVEETSPGLPSAKGRVLTGSRGSHLVARSLHRLHRPFCLPDTLIREWSATEPCPRLKRVLVGHSDWVTSLAVAPLEESATLVVSSSQDKSVRIWTLNPEERSCLQDTDSTSFLYASAKLCHHDEYVSVVALPETRYSGCDASPRFLLSGDVGGRIALVDVERRVCIVASRESGKSLDLSPQRAKAPDQRHPLFLGPGSSTAAIRSLGFTQHGQSAYACAGQQLALWDLRTRERTWFCPNAHADLSRCFRVTSDGYRGISGGSDGVVRLWDFRKGHHEPYGELAVYDSIWALWADSEAISDQIIIGTRGGTLFAFDSKDMRPPDGGHSDQEKPPYMPSTSVYSVEAHCTWAATVKAGDSDDRSGLHAWQKSSILSLDYDPGTMDLWVATGNSSVMRWNLASTPPENGTIAHREAGGQRLPAPNYRLPGHPKLVEARLLRDQRTVVTRSLENQWAVWDIVEGTQTRIADASPSDDLDSQLVPFISVLPWCSIDVALGVIRVTMEPTTAFVAETLVARSPGSPRLVNYGCTVLDRLFKNDTRRLAADGWAARDHLDVLRCPVIVGIPAPNSLSPQDHVVTQCYLSLDSTVPLPVSAPASARTSGPASVPASALASAASFASNCGRSFSPPFSPVRSPSRSPVSPPAFAAAFEPALTSVPAWVQNWVSQGLVSVKGPPTIPVCFTPSPEARLLDFSQLFLNCKRWTLLSTIVTHLLKNGIRRSESTPVSPMAQLEDANWTNGIVLTCQEKRLDLSWDIGSVRDRSKSCRVTSLPAEISICSLAERCVCCSDSIYLPNAVQ